ERLRREAKEILNDSVRPRSYILQKLEDFYARHLAGHRVIGVHARGTDATSTREVRAFRNNSLVLSRYTSEIEDLLERHPRAKIFVATDEESSLRQLEAAFPQRVIPYDRVRHQD